MRKTMTLLSLLIATLSSCQQLGDASVNIGPQGDVQEKYLTVSRLTDAIPSATGTLRDSIEKANKDPNKIYQINVVLHREATIQLVSPLIISGNIKINSNWPLTLTGLQGKRIIHVAKNGELTLQNLILIDGNAGVGGCLLNEGYTTLNSVTMQNCRANIDGGAISNSKGGQLKIVSSDFINNSASQRGGAISNYGDIDLSNVLFDGNSAVMYGGAIFNNGKGLDPNIEYRYTESRASLLFRENIQITRNSVLGNGLGGGIYNAGWIGFEEDVNLKSNKVRLNNSDIQNFGVINFYKNLDLNSLFLFNSGAVYVYTKEGITKL